MLELVGPNEFAAGLATVVARRAVAIHAAHEQALGGESVMPRLISIAQKIQTLICRVAARASEG